MPHRILRHAVALVAALVAGCATTSRPTTSTLRYAEVDATKLAYIEEGRGEPVVLVHGAVSDLRTWERQRAALASRHRVFTYTQRYFGTDPWAAGWPKFGARTQAADLAALIRGLGAGPVHLVAWSSGGHVALNVALHHPELVKSAFVFEPVIPSYVTDPTLLKAIGDDAAALVGPVIPALQAGDTTHAARLFIDSVAERPGYFDALAATAQTVVFDNARTLPLTLGEGERDAPITCEELATIKPPTAIGRGGAVRPFFRVIADAAARCMPRARHIIVPNAGHMWPADDVAGFSATVMRFIGER